MTNSIAALVSRIIENTSSWRASDDVLLNEHIVRDQILVARAALIAQSATLDLWVQECCYDVQCVEVCNSTIFEQRIVIPGQLLDDLPSNGVMYVGSADRKFSFGQRNSVSLLPEYLPFKNTRISYFYKVISPTEILLLNAPPSLKKVVVRAILFDPFQCGCTDPENVPFIPGDKVALVEKAVMFALNGIRRRDPINDAEN